MEASSTDVELQVETTNWIDQFCSPGSPKLTHPELSHIANPRHLPSFCVLNNKAQSQTSFPHSDLYTEAQYSRLEKAYAIKQLLRTRGQSNNFHARRTTPWLLAAFDTTSRKWVSNVNLESKNTPRIRTLLAFSRPVLLRVRPPCITGRIGLRPANHHGYRSLRIEPRVPLQSPRVNCCQILIQRFHHLTTRKPWPQC